MAGDRPKSLCRSALGKAARLCGRPGSLGLAFMAADRPPPLCKDVLGTVASPLMVVHDCMVHLLTGDNLHLSARGSVGRGDLLLLAVHDRMVHRCGQRQSPPPRKDTRVAVAHFSWLSAATWST